MTAGLESITSRQQFGQWLARRLDELGIARRRAAARIGVAAPTVGSYVRGASVPGADKEAALAEVLQVPAGELAELLLGLRGHARQARPMLDDVDLDELRGLDPARYDEVVEFARSRLRDARDEDLVRATQDLERRRRDLIDAADRETDLERRIELLTEARDLRS